ncbi:VOC family protein [Lysobacter sp. A3-1-A15]|uniref:VOC family protein n=1 Tax=Novilysobacter viscosus TaxID=3098602 RepID=UPI002EDB3ECF
MFVNLPVRDLDRSVAFFTALGFSFNPAFTNENATCMLVGEDAFVMLLVEPFFRQFTDKQLCDTSRSIEALVALSADSREGVDALLRLALAAGAREPRPAQDHGFMYQRSFEDLDGHAWELFHMAGEPA